MKRQRLREAYLAVLLVLFVSSLGFAETSLESLVKGGKVYGEAKALSYTRVFDDTPKAVDRQSNAVGGDITFETGQLFGFNAGVGFKTSQGGDFQDEDKSAYPGMLATGNEGYSAMSRYFLRYSGYDTVATVGAQSIDTPWMERHEIRMTDRAYKGYSVVNKSLKGSTFQALYITEQMDWTSTTFKPLAVQYNSPFTTIPVADQNTGETTILGWDWNGVKDLKTRLWYYHHQDIYQEFYASAAYTLPVSKEVALFFRLAAFKQDDVGDSVAGSKDTLLEGGYIGVGAYGARLMGYYAKVDGDYVDLPFGGGRDDIVRQIIFNSTFPESNSWSVRLMYDVGKLGVKGLTAYVQYGEYDIAQSYTNQRLYDDLKETDFDLTYMFGGKFKGVYARARLALCDFEEKTGGRDFADTRFYLGYVF